jgi:hypothetical protein
VLRGALPAGDYGVNISGFQQTHDAVTHADLLWRHNGSDTTILSLDGQSGANDAGTPGDITGSFHGDALPSVCGDLLVLRFQMLAGSDGYIELGASLDIP